jgi:NAD-dependent DNA ligase
MSSIENITEKELLKYLEEEDLLILHKLKLYYDNIYYNSGDSGIEDWRYDLIKDKLKERDPEYVPPIGAKIREDDNSVMLPFYLGSADKFTPEEKSGIMRWVMNNPSDKYVISDKLDGVSGLFGNINGVYKLFTRGNGIEGSDISHVVPYIKGIPKELKNNVWVRGELIIRKELFESKYRNKNVNGKVYKCGRNMVSGILNAKTARSALHDLHFVTYEIVEDNPEVILNQMKELKRLGFEVVKYGLVNKLSVEILKKLHIKFKKESKYEIDGIIVSRNTKYDRYTKDNPDYMFAFKMRMDKDVYRTIVKDVEWNVSKWGKIIPVVVFEPVDIKDATLERVSANNAKYIEDNKIGPDSVIEVTRSKEVIPYIVRVIKSTGSKFPDMDYKWDDNRVHIIATGDEVFKTSCIKKLADFFKKMNIDYVAEATVKKLYESGFDNLLKILSATPKDFMLVPTIKEKSAIKIYNNLKKGFTDVDVAHMIGASGVLGEGIGLRKTKELLRVYPNIISDSEIKSRKELYEKVLSIEGFADITALNVVKHINIAKNLLDKLKPFVTFKKKEEFKNRNLEDMKIVMTGFRDKELEKEIIKRGGKIATTVSKKTSMLIVKELSHKLTGKSQKAKDLGIPIIEKEKFRNKFLK